MVKLIDFHAEWCGPCKKQEPIIDEVKEYFEDKDTDFEVEKVDVDKEAERAQEYEVRSVPTIVIEDDGEILKKFIGLTQKDEIVDAIQN